VIRLRAAAAPTFATLAALAVLITLGVWQLERRAWKADILARFSQALEKPPVPFEGKNEPEFTRVEVVGRFLNDRTAKVVTPTPVELRARTPDGFGYLMFVPLRFAHGIVFVNRGFVPGSLADNPDLFEHGETKVVGIVRTSDRAGWFSPPADTAKHLFYDADIPKMAAASGLPVEGTILDEYIQAEPAAGAPFWPHPRDPHALLAAIPNRHFEYALTWFGLAAALALVYGFYIARA
jgi:surfeit locus 1 family protein